MVQIYYMFFTQLHITFCSVLYLYINICINTKIPMFHKKINNNEKILYKTSYFMIKCK